MPPTPHDAEAYQHYLSLIEQRYPPDLAVGLAVARYAYGLGAAALPLPAIRDALEAVREAEPELRRDIGRTTAAIDRREHGQKWEGGMRDAIAGPKRRGKAS